jgi:hypothetical protein
MAAYAYPSTPYAYVQYMVYDMYYNRSTHYVLYMYTHNDRTFQRFYSFFSGP